MNSKINQLFRQGSRTYYNATRFFPKNIREEVFRLYAFVRQADNYIDNIPADLVGWQGFLAEFREARNGKKVGDVVIKEFIKLARTRQFPNNWVDSFLGAMQQDLSKKTYGNLAETEAYIYGSAEVIGLMMARIMRLPEEVEPHARHLGKAMQYGNFLRDIREDLALGRTYFPQTDLAEVGLADLQLETVSEELNKPKFIRFMHKQIARYQGWQQIAEQGYKFIPKRHLIAVKTAADMYNWTLTQISQDPFIVYRKKVKPSSLRIILAGVWNFLKLR